MTGKPPVSAKGAGDDPDQRPEVDPIIGEAVGTQLKSLFDEFASEAVPDRFRDLLGKLEASERDADHNASESDSDGAADT